MSKDRSLSAMRGWDTRRKNKAVGAEKEQEKREQRSLAAKRGWDTRKRNEAING